MKKNINYVLIGALTVLSLILAFPFTPLRNSFTGVTSKATGKALATIGVDLDAKLKNARLISSTHQYEINNPDFVIKFDSKGRILKSGLFKGMRKNLSDGNYYESDLLLNRNSGVSNINGNVGINSVRKDSKQSTASQGGFVSISSKINNSKTNTTNSTTKQSANGDNNGTGGGTHPGVDPSGPLPSLPIGNGSTFMLLLVILFGVYKTRRI